MPTHLSPYHPITLSPSVLAILASTKQEMALTETSTRQARQTERAVATESRRGGAAEKFPPESDGERAKRAA